MIGTDPTLWILLLVLLTLFASSVTLDHQGDQRRRDRQAGQEERP